jgi:hypothetical protein
VCFREDVRIGVLGIKARDLMAVWKVISFFSRSGMRWISFSYKG